MPDRRSRCGCRSASSSRRRRPPARCGPDQRLAAIGWTPHPAELVPVAGETNEQEGEHPGREDDHHGHEGDEERRVDHLRQHHVGDHTRRWLLLWIGNPWAHKSAGVPKAASARRDGPFHRPSATVTLDLTPNDFVTHRQGTRTVKAGATSSNAACAQGMELTFAEVESTFDYFCATRRYLERHGKPMAFYGPTPVARSLPTSCSARRFRLCVDSVSFDGQSGRLDVTKIAVQAPARGGT